MEIKEKISIEYQRIESIVTEENPLIDGAIKDGVLNDLNSLNFVTMRWNLEQAG